MSDLKIKAGSGKQAEGFVIPEVKEVCAPLSQRILNACDFESRFPPTHQAAFAYCKVLVFNEVPRDLLNEAILMITSADSRGSMALTELLVEVSSKQTEGMEEANDFIEKFKKILRGNAEKKLKIIMETIIKSINQSYFSGTLKTVPVFRHHAEVACLDLGEVPASLIPYMKTLPLVFGTKVNMVLSDGKANLYYEVEAFPSSGTSLSVPHALALATWNETIGDRLGLYVEVLKMSSELLGEFRRKKLQSWIETLYEFIYY